MGKVVDITGVTMQEQVEKVEAEKVVEQNILDMMRTTSPPTPYYEVKNILTKSIEEFGNVLEEAINEGSQILQMGVIEDKHYALIVVASIV